MDGWLSTLQVSRLFGVGEWRLHHAIRTGKLTPPAKTPAGDYLWTLRDLRAVAEALDLPCAVKTRGAASKTQVSLVQEDHA